jgi:hypothetical protein
MYIGVGILVSLLCAREQHFHLPDITTVCVGLSYDTFLFPNHTTPIEASDEYVTDVPKFT